MLVSASALRDFDGRVFVSGLSSSLLAEHCLHDLCVPATAGATEALEIESVQVLT